MATVLLTGANRGIGLELARQLHDRGDEVIAAVRTSSEALDALGVRVETGIDVGTDDGPATLASRIEGVRLDVLINNAGVLRGDSLGGLERAQLRLQFEINALGPLFVTEALRSNLAKGSKVGIVTSRMGSIADNDSGGMYGYRMSKAAVNAAGKSLAQDLASDGVSVALLHPGWVQTEMTGGMGHVTAAESAAGLIARIDALTPEHSGTFWHMNGEVLPW